MQTNQKATQSAMCCNLHEPKKEKNKQTKLANHESNNFDKHFDCNNNQNFNKNKYL